MHVPFDEFIGATGQRPIISNMHVTREWRYSWNIAKGDVKHQSINQSYYKNHM
jgi:hypothetical protein